MKRTFELLLRFSTENKESIQDGLEFMEEANSGKLLEDFRKEHPEATEIYLHVKEIKYGKANRKKAGL